MITTKDVLGGVRGVWGVPSMYEEYQARVNGTLLREAQHSEEGHEVALALGEELLEK